MKIYHFRVSRIRKYSVICFVKITLTRRSLTTVVLIFCCHILLGQRDEPYQFIANQGQWEDSYAYRCRIPSGELFLSGSQLTWLWWNEETRTQLLDKMHHRIPAGADTLMEFHAVRQEWVGAKFDAKPIGNEPFEFYHNYFLGSDPAKWKSQVPIYKGVRFEEVYEGIDYVMHPEKNTLKYEWVCKPGSNPAQIMWKYLGADAVKLEDDMLRVTHSLGHVEEQKPFAYQVIGADTLEVACTFIKKGKKWTYKLGKYDKTQPLVIDPALIFSTYSGSNNDNFGYTATYDYNGSAYGGGIVFGGNPYPSQTGAFQGTYGGGAYDVLLGKYNANGTQLTYFTFLGGSRADAPYSLVVNNNNELYILGVTGSANFPVSNGAFQPAFAGGTPINFFGGGQEFPSGSDLFITKLDPNGAVMLGSTYIGGTGNDGLNNSTGLKHNYADEFRGEIIVDANGDAYIASSTLSTNFPVANAAQPNSNGGQEAVVFKMNSNLSSRIWATYLGGSSNDAAFSLQRKSNGEIYVTGGTTSQNFPATPGAFKTNNSGGVDGYVARLSPNGNAILSATYLGTASYDQCYILQFDQNEDVYVVGQTKGAYPVVSGMLGPVYSNPNSGQFIHKLNQNLSATLFSTVFGRGIAGQIDIVPTAFLVDICNHIYVAGWGGAVNSGFGGGSTTGLPTTPGAYKTNTDGSDFYFIVLDQDATALNYASFFGGNISDEHVDGGTSRFDKTGVIYEAVCAGCGGFDDFPTTPGAHSSTNNSSNCNLGIFKFDVSEFSALIDPQSPTQICENGTVTLNNISSGGDSFHWDFGDGTTSNQGTVTHTYSTPGTYQVMLIVQDADACIPSDTAFLTVIVNAVPNIVVTPVPVLCQGDSLVLQVSGAQNYIWTPSPTLINGGTASPTVFPASQTTYTVTGTNICGSDVENVTVQVSTITAFAGLNDTLCLGSSTQLQASGGVSYQWLPAAGLDNPAIPNPVATPNVNTTYVVSVMNADNCVDTDTLEIVVEQFPVANAGPDRVICEGDATQIQATGGTQYNWSPASGLNNANIPNPLASPSFTTTYVVAVSNTCGTDRDTLTIQVIRVNGAASPDTIICPGDTLLLYATGGVAYHWEPASSVQYPDSSQTLAWPGVPTVYVVQISDPNGCSAFDSVFVDLYPVQDPDLGPDILIEFGDYTHLYAQGNGSFLWTPDSSLSCNTCSSPVASPFSSTLYNVTLTDTNGCKFTDSIYVFVEGSLYIPNTFTPNRDNLNDIFYAYGVEIKSFEMRIFTRWGEEIFYTNDLAFGWDGFHKNKACPIGVYVYKADFTQLSGKKGQLIGHVNLLR